MSRFIKLLCVYISLYSVNFVVISYHKLTNSSPGYFSLLRSSANIESRRSMKATKFGPGQKVVVNLQRIAQQIQQSFEVEPEQSRIEKSPPSTPKIITEISDLSTIQIPSVIITNPDYQGIGDQLYRYAFSYATAQKLNATLYLALGGNDLNQSRQFRNNQRSFALDQFNLDPETGYIKAELIPNLAMHFKGKIIFLNEAGPFWNNTQFLREKVIVVNDGWQAEMYWIDYVDDIKRQFALKQDVIRKITKSTAVQNMYTEILKTESVAVHIRRGDFLSKNASYSRVLPLSYQIKAMKLMKTRLLKHKVLTFFIFSDDNNTSTLKSALELTFNGSNELTFVANNGSSVIDFYLMTNCKHFIIANSGFSWWTAYLGSYEDKFVIAPFPRHRFRFYEPWGKNPYRKHKEWLYWNKSYPEDWITLNPYESFQDSM